MPTTIILPDAGLRSTRRIARRLLPFLFVLYVVAFLDRVNVGYAGLEMSRDLHFSDKIFGLGAGIFSIGYFLFEIPGALIVERWSARKWIARILITWGIVTILMAAVHTPRQFYLARFLLGVAEAGFFPGIVVYLTHWFRYQDRAKAGAIFMAAIPMSSIVGSPLAGWILSQHWAGVASWRWLFVVEGIPAILFGILTLVYLTDWPLQADWLAADEREWINAELQREKTAKGLVREWTIWQAIRSREVILLTLVYFFAIIGIYGFVIWFPTIVQRATNLSNMAVTLLAALPYVVGLAAMIWNGWHSDRTDERRWHTAFPLFLGAGCLALAIYSSTHLAIAFTCMIVVGACTTAFMPSFWALPTAILSESAAAASIGLINSVANLGGFAGPFFIGYLRTKTSSFTPGLLLLLICMVISGLLALLLHLPGPRANQRADASTTGASSGAVSVAMS
ncbi:MAG TPA: MFS transporter [Candidatus Acidoferrales bacterium]|nr:MFS transporter [Candidatus Acidoferrales bacterium]